MEQEPKNKGKRVLVTGGAGFVGTHLAKRLLDEGHSVIVVDNYFAGSRENHVSGVEYREGHTKDIEELVSEEVDLIYHLGEYARVEKSVEEPNVVWDLNVVGTQAVLEFWRKRKCKLVYAGSSTKFGDGGLARDTSPYAWSKAANTELVKNYATWFNLPYAITYFYNVFGPGERGSGPYATLIGIFREQYKKGQPLTVVSPGTQLRNFTHVFDIVEGLMLVGDSGEGDEYGLGNEKAFSVLEVARLFGTDIIMLPERQGNRMTSGLNTAKSRTLGWRALNVLEDELHKIIQEFRGAEPFEKRVMVLTTTFYPVMGPAEEALCDLMRAMPDVKFDVITSAYSKDARGTQCPISNAVVHRLGWGWKLDKYLLPLLGYFKAWKLSRKHHYLFAWTLTASYASLAALLLKKLHKMPLVITLADQEFNTKKPVFTWMFLQWVLRSADQVFATDIHQEDVASKIASRPKLRHSIGSGDAFANQLRFTYKDILRKRVKDNPKTHSKRILIFSLAYYPTFVGGAEVAIKEITDRVKDVEFHMITLRFDSTQPKEERIGNVIVHRVGLGKRGATAAQTYRSGFYISKVLFVPLAAWYAFRLNRKFHFDGGWAMMSYMLFPLVIMRFMGIRIPYALTLQEGDPFDHTFKRWYIGPFTPLLKIGFRNAAVVQSISTFLSRWALKFDFKGSLEIIPNAVNVKLFSRTVQHDELKSIKEKIGKRHGDVWLIHTGRLAHKNAIDDVIKSLVLLPNNIHAFLLGDGPEKLALERIAKESGVSGRVHFHPYVPIEEIPQYLKACDIFIRPSRSEGMGNSFVEAMATGLPVIATQEGGISDFLFDPSRKAPNASYGAGEKSIDNSSVNIFKYQTGWAVEKDSPESIANAVRNILARPDKVRQVVDTARKMVFKKYDWDIIARDMHDKVFNRVSNT